ERDPHRQAEAVEGELEECHWVRRRPLDHLLVRLQGRARWMSVSSVGREMFRGSSDILTTQTSGNSTVKLMKTRTACSMSCLPQPARKKARRRRGTASVMA